MITIRPSNERGTANLGWLKARHSFSFSSYQDPRHMGHSALRVINQDSIAAGGGFGQHGHDNMEILTYVLSGTLTHQDTLGNRAEIQAGEFQLMSAGTGIQHSELNRYPQPIELLQIWLFPNVRNAEPRYAQKTFANAPGLVRIAAADGEDDNALPIRQDASIYRGQLALAATQDYAVGEGRSVWIQVISGSISVNNRVLVAGDGAAISAETTLTLSGLSGRADDAGSSSEFLFFDLP